MARIVSVTVNPNPPLGMLAIHYTTPRGGRSTVGHLVRDGDTPDFIASELARRIVNDRQWCPGQFDAKAAGSQFLIICQPDVANVTIMGDPGSEALTISEWGA